LSSRKRKLPPGSRFQTEKLCQLFEDYSQLQEDCQKKIQRIANSSAGPGAELVPLPKNLVLLIDLLALEYLIVNVDAFAWPRVFRPEHFDHRRRARRRMLRQKIPFHDHRLL